MDMLQWHQHDGSLCVNHNLWAPIRASNRGGLRGLSCTGPQAGEGPWMMYLQFTCSQTVNVSAPAPIDSVSHKLCKPHRTDYPDIALFNYTVAL